MNGTEARGLARGKLAHRRARVRRRLLNDWQIYALLAPAMIYILLFHYFPIYGAQIAFKDFLAVRGINGSAWAGLKHFQNFFKSYYWSRMLVNTVLLNFYSLVFGFPFPIFLALLINMLSSVRYKRFVQTTIYAPHFISVVVLAGMLYIFLSPTNGIFNKVIEACGGKPIYFLNEARWFRTVYIASSIWQNAGWGSIIYIAALTSVDVQLYEAAKIDGANKWHRIWYIDLPSIMPVAVTMLIMNTGRLFSSEFQKTLLLQTNGNISVSDTIGVYVYSAGLGGGQFSYTTAIGLMTNVVNFVLLLTVNWFSEKISDKGIL